MSTLVFESNRMQMTGKRGITKPDASGYYEVILGGFNIHNSGGAYYPYNEVKNLFTSSSDLMQRVSNGQLYGEWGHPKMSPGMSDRDYLIKLLTMHEEQISHHIKRIELNENFKSPEGGTCVGVVGWVKPFGPKAAMVEQGLNTPEINFAFSLRSISHDKRAPDGKLIKVPVKIQTYDAVAEQGIEIADKYNNPAVESRTVFTASTIEEALEKASVRGSGLESRVHDLEGLLRTAKRTGGITISQITRDTLGMKQSKPSTLMSW